MDTIDWWIFEDICTAQYKNRALTEYELQSEAIPRNTKGKVRLKLPISDTDDTFALNITVPCTLMSFLIIMSTFYNTPITFDDLAKYSGNNTYVQDAYKALRKREIVCQWQLMGVNENMPTMGTHRRNTFECTGLVRYCGRCFEDEYTVAVILGS